MRGQHEAGLEGFGHHLGGAGGLELEQARVVGRAHQHRHVGAQPAQAAQDGERRARIGERDDHRVGVGETDFLEHLLVGGIAVHHRLAHLPRGAHAHRVEIDGDVFEALRFEHARHVLADAAEAAQDHVLALGDGQRRRVLAFDRGFRRAALAQQQARHALVVGEDHRRQHHAQHHGDQQRLRDGRIDGLVLQQQREQRDAEFAADRERDAGANAP